MKVQRNESCLKSTNDIYYKTIPIQNAGQYFCVCFVFWVFLNPKFPSTTLRDLPKSLSKSFSAWNIFEE